MPFHNNDYYPYRSDTQGTHSSAGIQSLLNSPLSHYSVPAAGMTPSRGTSTVHLPFKFRRRRETVDWQRINAVDINLVMSQLDINALQDHISTVTFCNLDGERCQQCRSPVDPGLLKLLQLAQLTVEWLLHCQEFLSLNLHALEERLEAASKEHKQLLEQQSEQEEKVKALKEALLLKGKEVHDLQSKLLLSSHKCQICKKGFLTPQFLQSHMQRRHPEDHESQLQSDSEKKCQIEILKMEISGLREQNVQLQQNLQLKTAQEKELLSTHKDLQRELDRFKAEEMTRMERKIEDTKDGMRREMESMYNRNVQAVNALNQNQISKLETSADSAHSQKQIIQKLEQQLKKQDKMWESMLQKNKEQHESEKNQLLDELSRTQSSVSEQQERSQQLQQEMGRRLQEKQQTIKAQREQIRNISSNTPTKVVEVPVVVSAPAPEPKPKRVVLEEPVFALNLEPIQELSEEEKDSSSASERRPEPVPEKKPSPSVTATALKRNPSIKKAMRRELEQAVIKKLEDLGVKPNQRGLTNRELTSIMAKVHSERDRVAKGMPEYWRCREEITRSVDEKMSDQTREAPPETPARPRHSVRGSDTLSVTLVSGPAGRQSKTPQPAPRAKSTTQPKTSTPNSKAAPRTFTLNSDEDSEEEDTEEKQPPKHQRGRSPPTRMNQATPVHIRAGKASPVQARQAVTRQTFSSSTQQPWGSVGVVTKTAVKKMESDDDDDDDEDDDDKEEWSEVSELQEIDSKQLQGYRDQNGNVDKRNFKKDKKITVLARKVEQKFATRTVKRPAGGVSILTERRDEVQELTYTDLEESQDWLVSSLEDGQEVSKPAQGSGPMRKSLDSSSTSVWGTSTGKAPRSAGLTEAGTGSTLKSSLCSLGDFSDSEDTSNKPSGRYS
ncbi:zinc finger protein Dzip1 isoform X3 [Hippoglossus hippoglossus]|uniref:zinc finger protein Dzip1 isoform X3 n=1 Tax=Hippoglossus hippoglossus TaxID=8267 RepID=UPI00148DA88D|nr:zinc finger protein Dzip1 isoform X3 [Hippoglossus hippoglossus]